MAGNNFIKTFLLKKFIYSGLVIAIVLSACGKGGGSSTTDPCAGLAFTFAANVQPIINTTCAINSSCHAAGSINSGGPFTDYNKIFSHRSEIKFQIETGQMPKTGSLTAAQKNTIICWINSGAPNN